MKIKLWGVRGSIPAPILPKVLESQKRGLIKGFLEKGHSDVSEIDAYLKEIPDTFLSGYGGNTLCVQVVDGDHSFIIDGGSGIRGAGLGLLAGPCGKGKGVVHLFFTHFHWDHIIGLPFFVPFYIPGNQIHIHCVQDDAERAMRLLFQRPFFPKPYEELGATITYHKLAPREVFELDGFSITPYQLDHPDPCWGYRVECGGKSYAHCVDTECKRFTTESLGPDLPLYENADLMLFDAQYTLLESIEKIDWGHSTANLGLDIAMSRGIKKVLFAHHDPSASEAKIYQAEMQTREYYELQLQNARRAGKTINPVKWMFAREGMEIAV